MVPAKRPCGVVSSSGTLMVMYGESSPHKDLAISAKPGRGSCFYVMGLLSGVFAFWQEMLDELALAVLDFDCPISWVTRKEPWVWALLLLLQLCSHVVSGPTVSEGLDEVIFTQCNGISLVRTSSSVNDVSSSLDSLNSHMQATSW